MNDEHIKVSIKNFLKNNSLTVIATVDEEKNRPECAVIAFAETDKLELIFGTSNTTRKYKNIQKNKNVSFVIGWDGRIGTVQYEGVVRELSDTEAAERSEILFLKNKQSAKFRSMSDQRYFLVTPTWIRLTDNTPGSAGVYEVSF